MRDAVALAALGAVVLLHVVVCPFSKVEESFNTQAVHDAWVLGPARWAEWDHHEFAGTVPRTFLGALPVAAVGAVLHRFFAAAAPAWRLARAVGCGDLLCRQVCARWGLALLWLAGFARFRAAAADRFGGAVGAWLAALTAAQFHAAFYASRLLPNSMAMPLVLGAHGEFLRGRRCAALGLLSLAVFALRCDVAALALPLGLIWCFAPWAPRLPLARAAAATIACALVAVAASTALDSALWAAPGEPVKWLWPEGAVLLYNNPVENRSAAWGVSSWHWYASDALPRALSASAALAVAGAVVEPRRVALDLLLPAAASVALLSILPHKELRFIFPALPLFTLAAAVGADRCCSASFGHARSRSPKARARYSAVLLVRLAPWACLFATAATTSVFVRAARVNYAGGAALRALHAHFGDAPPARVHIDTLAAVSGASRFGEERRGQGWAYDKREDLLSRGDYDAYDYRLAELPLQSDRDASFDVVANVHAYAGVALERKWPFVVVKTRPQIAILRHIRRRPEDCAEEETCAIDAPLEIIS
ncbi:Alg9-like mannosyltransferase family-domain-containing protein [Pelagophyceae sp. CCMP2097]|nr:Alg9-like mannosyltransferase family-domain-containing protein [Pelagophyceae sp. CCMP2097]